MEHDSGVRIDIRGDAASFKRAAQEAALELNKLQAAGDQVAETTKRQRAEAERYLVNLQKEAVLLGQGEAARRRLEVSMLNITEAQRQQALAVVDHIEAYKQGVAEQERMAVAGRRMGVAIGTAAVAAAATLAKITYEAMQAAAAAEQIDAKLNSVLRATGQAAGLARVEIEALARAMQGQTGIDNDKFKNAAAVMLTYRNVQGETFKEGIRLAADLSAVMGTDLTTATQQLGRALNDPEQALGSLTRAGVQFSYSQQKMIKDFVETGQLGKAQAIIIDELKNKLGGAAEAMNTGYTKATNELKTAWDDLLKTFGSTPAVKESATGTLSAISWWLTDIKNSLEHGDTANVIMSILGRGYFGAPAAKPRAEGPSRANDALAWSQGLGDLRDPRDIRASAQYGQTLQQAQQIIDAENRFLDKFKSNHERMEEEIGKARIILGKYPDLLGRVIAQIREKYKEAAPKDEFAQLMNRLVGLDANFGKELATLYQGYRQGETGLEGYRQAVEALIEKQQFAKDLAKESADQLKQEEKLRKSMLDIVRKELDGVDKEVERESDRVAAIGKSKEAVEELKAAKQDKMAVEKEEYADALQAAAVYAGPYKDAYIEAANAERDAAAKHRSLAGLHRDGAAKEAAVETWRDIERAAHDAFMHIGEKGRNTWQRLNDALKNTLWESLYRMTAKKWIIQIEQQITGAAGGGGSGDGGGLGGLFDYILGRAGGAGSMNGGGSVQGNAAYYYDLHTGGIVGGGGSALRPRDPAIFSGARRLHGGGVAGLAHDEEPTILRQGEGVFTPQQMRALAPAAPPFNIVINNHAPVQVSQREVTDSRGRRSLEVNIEEAVAGGMRRPGAATYTALRQGFGVTPVLTGR